MVLDMMLHKFMKRHFLSFVMALGIAMSGAVVAETAQNELTSAEKDGGWKLLFDGKTTQGWRGFKKPSFPDKGWVIKEGWLKHIAGGGGGDLVSEERYTDFELTWEWRIPAGANNGIKYMITEERDTAIGHEYQMIDDQIVADSPKLKTASFYDVLPPKDHAPVKFAPDTNFSRILVQGLHVEHWLNGEKVLEYQLGSDEVKAAVAKSKFKKVEGFGDKATAHILLTEHHDEASFRNIKIRPLTVK
jgi:hypothetical protein